MTKPAYETTPPRATSDWNGGRHQIGTTHGITSVYPGDFVGIRNTEAGQRFVDDVIAAIGGVDFIIFDNIMSLILGDMKEEESWSQTIPWVKSLTRRQIGQLWVHHTGIDESRSYGTKTKEWQLDTVIILERADEPAADLAFTFRFTKARERTPDNRAEFEPVTITLTGDHWKATTLSPGALRQGNRKKAALPPSASDALEKLDDVLARSGVPAPANEKIPADVLVVTLGQWREHFWASRAIKDGSGASPNKRMAWSRAKLALVKAGHIGIFGVYVWRKGK